VPNRDDTPRFFTPEEYGIALDIGTTTLAFELFGHDPSGTIVRRASYSCVNAQRKYGADVISRIQRATDGDAALLHELIHQDLRNGVAHLIEMAGITSNQIRHMAIAGNTTMLHLLHNLPCDTLGVFPFKPVDIKRRAVRFDFLPQCEAFTMPGISTFVGADIVAGLMCLGSGSIKNPCDCPNENAHVTSGNASFLLVDLGTNGEIALVHRGKIYAAATAAGPAFEAANISCGVGSVTGAICGATYDPAQKKFIYETIGSIGSGDGTPPIGICGTGVLEITAELLRHNFLSPTGRLYPHHHENGVPLTDTIALTQADLREVQTAKSAIRAGIEILLQSANCTPQEITHVYIAGGFGTRLRPQTAAILGLLPEALAHKAQSVGNTALGGAVRTLLSTNATDEADNLVARATEVNLAAHPQFNDLFMQYISFGEE